MSSFNGSSSSNQSNIIVTIISNIFNINNLDILSYLIRKTAHLTEYAILGILTNNMIKNNNIKLYIGLLICIIYAISDEIHQLFVEGRSGQISDVLVDFTGSIVGICLFFVVINRI
jgi:VanZ family protein